jgi:alpha-beta hydrolase superfamily lysophospholipase
MKLKLTAATIAAALMMTLAACTPTNPYQRGPAPTEESLAADLGPYAFASFTVADADTPGFGPATIYYPTTTADGTFGGVAIAPGFGEGQSAVSWFGPRLSSHGFVVITFNTNNGLDAPAARATQLLAALDYLTGDSAVSDRVDGSRLSVMGHSMGGGGALGAVSTRPSLQAAIPLTAWHTDGSWPEITTPTLIVAAENDQVAPSPNFSRRFYDSLSTIIPKAYVEMAGADHYVTNNPNDTVARSVISWLKRFVDDDTRYTQFLCPPPPATGPLSESLSTCPYS